MLGYAFRRSYVALIGVMLFTLPFFAALRADSPAQPYCGEPPLRCDLRDIRITHRPMPGGWRLSAAWEGGTPPNDYWPFARSSFSPPASSCPQRRVNAGAAVPLLWTEGGRYDAAVMTEPLNLRDFEAIARGRMDAGAFAYYSGGAGDEHTLRENEAAFVRRRFRPRMLVDASRIDTRVTLLGERVAMPVGVAPTAQHRLAHPDGEAATARAAGAAGVMFCASTSSSLALEEIAASAGPLRWFQFYTQDNAGPRSEALLRRAEAAGYRAIVLTVDLAVSGRRERELRERFDIGKLRFGNFAGPQTDEDEAPETGLRPQDAPSAFTWDDLAWLRAQTALPLVIKGILTAEDAVLAVEHGAAAVWVSNHGARQLDRSPASLDVLEEIVAAVGGRAELYLDGGVRRGIDVATALALGARAVFLGRPVLWALAADGEAGVARALSMMATELRETMALLGTPSVAEITRAHVMPAEPGT